MVTLRYGNGLAIALVGAVVLRLAVQTEVIDGIFLRLGPQAFARDIGAHGRERIKAKAAQRHLKDHDGDERPCDAEQLWRFECAISLHGVPVTEQIRRKSTQTSTA
ncbi:hypothetical protein D9M71_687570 [compost metagenome]